MTFNPNMNNWPKFVLAALLASGVCAAENSAARKNYTVERIAALPLPEVWALGEVQRVDVGDLVVLLQRYDTEYGFTRNGLRYCAIFLVGSMDLGSRPVGFRILTSGECGSVAISKESGADDGNFSVVVGFVRALQVQVSRGGDVRIDGTTRGKLQR